MDDEPTVFVVDDDRAVRNALGLLMKSVGMQVETFADAVGFLNAYTPDRAGCLVVDVRLPGMSGPHLQERLLEQNVDIPLIFISGHGNISTAVRTIKAGAVDFVEKPFDEQVLLDCIQKAIERDARARNERVRHGKLAAALELLTPREKEVMKMLIGGKPNKLIARGLNVSTKTVETHRANIMHKLGIRSVAELVRMAMVAGIDPERP